MKKKAAPLQPLPDFSIPLGNLDEAMCVLECVVLALKERNDPHDRVLMRPRCASYAEIVCLEHVAGLLLTVYEQFDCVGVKVAEVK